MFITEAISSAPGGKLTTAAIYKWLQRHVAGLGGKDCDKIKWQVCVCVCSVKAVIIVLGYVRLF